MQLIILLVIAVIIFIFLILWVSYIWSIAVGFSGGAPFVPITKKVLGDVFKLAEIDDNSVFYDLGCGDGRVLAFGTKQNSKAQFVGIENSLMPYLLSKLKTRKNQKVQIIKQNMFKRDLSDATHIYVYLFPEMMKKLLPKFKQELKPGAVVIASDFNLVGMEPSKIVETGFTKGLGGTLYLYKF
jgi:SAM-dependent methyltransferase